MTLHAGTTSLVLTATRKADGSATTTVTTKETGKPGGKTPAALLNRGAVVVSADYQFDTNLLRRR